MADLFIMTADLWPGNSGEETGGLEAAGAKRTCCGKACINI
jgi:hypothetical protein